MFPGQVPWGNIIPEGPDASQFYAFCIVRNEMVMVTGQEGEDKSFLTQ